MIDLSKIRYDPYEAAALNWRLGATGATKGQPINTGKGIHREIFVNRLREWLECAGIPDDNGRSWYAKTVKDWHKIDFSFWEQSRIRSIIRSLEIDGYVISKRVNGTKAYSLNEAALAAAVVEWREKKQTAPPTYHK